GNVAVERILGGGAARGCHTDHVEGRIRPHFQGLAGGLVERLLIVDVRAVEADDDQRAAARGTGTRRQGRWGRSRDGAAGERRADELAAADGAGERGQVAALGAEELVLPGDV